MTPGEMKWLIRIILRGESSDLCFGPQASAAHKTPVCLSLDLKIGVGEKSIFDRLHPDAMSVFNACSDIMSVCYQLYDPDRRVPKEVRPSATPPRNPLVLMELYPSYPGQNGAADAEIQADAVLAFPLPPRGRRQSHASRSGRV